MSMDHLKQQTITIGDILTAGEINRAQDLWRADQANFHARCVEELIKPNLSRINQRLRQENDPDYLAYAVEFVLSKIL